MLNLLLLIKFKTVSFIFACVFFKYNILAYNLDVYNVKIFNFPKSFNYQRGNYFGFSTALYTNGKDSVLLVGAPRANSSLMQGVIEPGTVFQCPINGTCKEWIMDKAGNGFFKWDPSIMQVKDHAWIGATIAIENNARPRVVVCAPRWKWHRNKLEQEYMNGICYLSSIKNMKSFEEEADKQIFPLNMSEEPIVRIGGIHLFMYGMSQIGFSMHMTFNLLTQGVNQPEMVWNLMLGSPGIYNWKGTPLLYTERIGKEQIIIPSIKIQREIHAFDYFGYAVTSGYFIRGELWFASGAPRAEDMNGNVVMFTLPHKKGEPLNIQKILSGKNWGEYFGAALTSCNLNGDEKDELIVGAPQWSKDMDEGRIYVFTALSDEIFERQSVEGKVLGGRFGSTVTCLGDIDRDGYGDIAVGAPYEEETGAVYIFNGNSNGVLKYYSQRIIGKQFGANVRGFGISISEPCDINGDEYPDIAIGAYSSEQTFLIKSKPVIRVLAQLNYTENKKLLRNTTFFFIDVCTSYDGINAPDYVRVVQSLKIDDMYGRAYYNMEKNNNTYKILNTLYKAQTFCNELKINLKENIQNIIDPIEISISVTLEEDTRRRNEDTKANLFCTSCATINELYSKTKDAIKLPFAVDCGEDNTCVSDVTIALSTDLKTDNKYIVGSAPTTKVIIDAYNNGEPAYQAKICIYIPEVLSLAGIPPSCMESFHINNTLEVICDLGNPLRKDKRLILDLDMSKIRCDIDHVILTTNFITQSEEIISADNTPVLTIYFNADVDIAIAGKAQDDLYSYFLEDESEKLASIQFQHIYEVQKFGVSPIDEVVLTISIPTYWVNSDGDMQIASVNQTISYMDGQPFHCTYTNSTFSKSLVNKFQRYSANLELYMQEEFTIDTNFSINLPPENRSMYINCTNPNVKCIYIACELGPFSSSSSVAKLSLILDLYLFALKSRMMESKDIIFFLTSGNVNILEPHNIIQKVGHKPDNTIVATMFLGSPVAQQIEMWIVILSIVLGVLLLIILILALIKIGFFSRKKKKELEALKSQANKEHGIVLETSSSREVLDQEEGY